MRLRLLLPSLLLCSVGFASIATNDSGTRSVVEPLSATSLDLTTLTVNAGSNNCLIAVLSTTLSTASSITINWDQDGTPQAMTAVTSGGFVGVGNIDWFKLASPTTGNKKLHAAWTGASVGSSLRAINFSGADCTPDNIADSGPSVTNTPSIMLTSTSTGVTVAGVIVNQTINSTDTQTEIGKDSTVASASSYGLGGTTNTHTWTLAGNANAYVDGFHLPAAAASAGRCTMSLLGVGSC